MAEKEFDIYEDGEKTGTQSETKTSSKKSTGKKTNAFMQILNGEFLTKEFFLNNLNYIFFIMALLLVIVSKGYYGKQLIDDTNKTQRELDQKAAEYIEAKSRLEFVTRRYKLVEKLKSRDLQESQNTKKVIRLKKTDE
jgi:ABC-type transport system involved in cytochrome bd biosynthesis fused ATPase/permease subunit